jgi:hypothetical protein
MCAIIRKPTVSSPSLRASDDVLLGDVGLGAVGGDPDGGDAEILASAAGARPVPMPGSSSAETRARFTVPITAAQVFLVACAAGKP